MRARVSYWPFAPPTSPRLIALAGALALVVLAMSVLRATTGAIGDGAARAMNAALVALGPPAVAVGVLRDLRSSGPVRLEAVLGVLSLYIGHTLAVLRRRWARSTS